MAILDQIRTIVILMMENRSFDHMLGYLSLNPSNRIDVAGQSIDPAWLARYTNSDGGQSYAPFLSLNPYTMPDEFDPPHERPNVAGQLGPIANGTYPMNGFVGSLPASASSKPDVRKLVMSYFGAEQGPINHFLAENFAICDNWFSSLPGGTQPNRLMAMSGFSRIALNQTPLPKQDLIYDWLNQQGISWRVYHQGIPFFTMMPHWIPEILVSDKFRSFGDFESDLTSTPPDKQPSVIFVEPTYGDSPHLGRSTDDHAPSGISDGQEFIMQVYNAVTASPSFWKGALLIITYDEHGGFFDHASPPLIPTAPPDQAMYSDPFPSLGVRVPAFVVSPFVRPGSVHHNLFDHTSVLKLLGEKFGKGGTYSDVLSNRPVESASNVLDSTSPIFDSPAAPSVADYLAKRAPAPAGATVPTPDTNLKAAFRDALEKMKQNGADETHPKFGSLIAQVP